MSYAFETSNRATIERVKEAFIELADVLWDKFHGRVYLVKNVFAKKTTLAAMYGDHAVEFFRLKRELDPAESCETTSSSARSAIWSSASTRTTNRVGRRP
ncbi:MAG TPA: hypothetical protein VE523_05965 [Solirubrobacterales bacterium]|nr:hypothetical protein [Solirubrobacterales bacterium]